MNSHCGDNLVKVKSRESGTTLQKPTMTKTDDDKTFPLVLTKSVKYAASNNFDKTYKSLFIYKKFFFEQTSR